MLYMKRISMILVLLLVINLMGCTTQPETTDPSESAPIESSSPAEVPIETMWHQKIKFDRNTAWSAPVVETDTHFYYIAEDSVYEYVKDVKQISKIIPEAVCGLYLYEENLYYNTEHEVKCMNLDTGSVSLIWDETMLGDSDEYHYISLNDFVLHDGYLYIAGTGTSVMRVNLEDNTTEQFLGDCGSMVLLANDCYYLDHAERTFSLYRMTCDSKESTLLRGEGQSEPGSDKLRIDGIAGMEDLIAYSVRDASDIYLYRPDGNDEKIFDGDDSDQVWLFFVKRCPAKKLYFYTTDGSQLKLYEYQPQTGTSLLTSFDCATRICDIAITESAVFWWDEEESAVMIHLCQVSNQDSSQ